MKRLFSVAIIASLVMGSIVLASPQMKKIHRGMKKDGARIDCAYCHGRHKIVKNPEKNYNKYKTRQFCSGKGCHAN